MMRWLRRVREWLIPPAGPETLAEYIERRPLFERRIPQFDDAVAAEQRIREILAELIPPRTISAAPNTAWCTIEGGHFKVLRPASIQPPPLQFGEYIRDLCLNDLARELGIPAELLDHRAEPQLGPFNGFCRPLKGA